MRTTEYYRVCILAYDSLHKYEIRFCFADNMHSYLRRTMEQSAAVLVYFRSFETMTDALGHLVILRTLPVHELRKVIKQMNPTMADMLPRFIE